MSIGVSLFVIAVGAILAFAVDAEPAGIDIEVVGWILMGVGVLGLALIAVIWGQRGPRDPRGPGDL